MPRYVALVDMQNLAQRYSGDLGFALDEFQVKALEYVEQNKNVLVGAPTGAGKTVVGDAAIFFWLEQDGFNRVYYTTPIKALSNQKYHDLCKKYGETRVGLVTGDTVVNKDAQVIVMTTEVLRNQVYSDSSALENVKCVVFDEVHYLGDKGRGSVWEEVLIHLPRDITIIALSATVSNVEQFAAWLEKVRENCAIVVTDKRPVPLIQHIILSSDDEKRNGARIWDVYDDHGSMNMKLASKMQKKMPSFHKDRRGRRGKGRSFPNENKHKGTRKVPGRVAVIEELRSNGILPAIYFIFSRKGCDDALKQVMSARLNLTSREEQDEIRLQIDLFLLDEIPTPSDHKSLDLFGFENFKRALISGIATHHAGLIPVFKSLVEHLFERGLIKVVFATETLALGINMPAKSVVIESIIKYDGVKHVPLTPGQFTQLTGRAGRRGLDEIGHAFVVDGRNLTLFDVTKLSSARLYPLKSAFTPSFNMVANMSCKYTRLQIEHILNMSFAQFQVDDSAEEIQMRITRYTAQEATLKRELEQVKDKEKAKERLRRVKQKLKNAENDLHKMKFRIIERYAKLQEILVENEYIAVRGQVYSPSQKGVLLQGFYCENELTFIELLTSGVLKILPAANLISVLSCFVSVRSNSTSFVQKELVSRNSGYFDALERLQKLDKEYQVLVKRHQLVEEDGINYSLVNVMFLVGTGATVETVLKELGAENLGDLVRASRGILDLLSQIVRYAGEFTPENAQNAIEILRGSDLFGFLE
ncbi:MAG: DEAD/DEAH box helicase [Candidatus Ancillula sp.]|jgi:ATP-dependent RNA helicase HelY|nr:DEAD/DEAH box helicase [Candidatus Ancillula sp.]